MKKGLVLPNHCWGAWTAEEIEAIKNLKPHVVQVLIFRQQPDGIWAAQKLQLLDLERAIGCEFEYRMYGVGPGESPEYAVTWLDDKLGNLPPGKVIPFNEPNLASEGWLGVDWVMWARQFALFWKARGLVERLITPALSPSADGYFSGTDAMTQLVREGFYDYLGLHEYLNQIFSPIQVPVSITECNGKVPSEVFDYLKKLYPTAEEAIWFSSRWVGAEDPNYHWDLIGNEDLSASFVNWQGGALVYNRAEVWANYQRKLLGTPMFQKVRAMHPELGDALGPEYDVGDYRFQDYAGGIIYARIGDWQYCHIARIENELPFP